MRRQLATIATAAVLAGGLGLMWARADEPKAPHHHATPEMEACLKECARCARECESCLTHCTELVAAGKKEHVQTLRTCNDCGDLCALAAKLIARDGAFMNVMCTACAKACDGCGAECAKFPNDDHMSRCAQACKDCAKACRDMVKGS
jgi:hypothetical protein